jgi:hypothetical protein
MEQQNSRCTFSIDSTIFTARERVRAFLLTRFARQEDEATDNAVHYGSGDPWLCFLGADYVKKGDALQEESSPRADFIHLSRILCLT